MPRKKLSAILFSFHIFLHSGKRQRREKRVKIIYHVSPHLLMPSWCEMWENFPENKEVKGMMSSVRPYMSGLSNWSKTAVMGRWDGMSRNVAIPNCHVSRKYLARSARQSGDFWVRQKSVEAEEKWPEVANFRRKMLYSCQFAKMGQKRRRGGKFANKDANMGQYNSEKYFLNQ